MYGLLLIEAFHTLHYNIETKSMHRVNKSMLHVNKSTPHVNKNTPHVNKKAVLNKTMSIQYSP